MDISVSPPSADDDGTPQKAEAEKVGIEKAEAAAVEAKAPDSEIEAAPAEAAEPAAAESTAAPAVSAATKAETGAIIPYVAPEHRETPGEDSRHGARFDRLLGYGAHAALIVALVGFAWALSGYVIKGFNAQPAKPDGQAAALATERAEKAELQRATQSLAADIRTLKSNLEALRTAAAHAPTQEEVRGLEKTIDGLKAKLDATKAETGAALAQVAGKVDHLQAEPAAKLREVAERLERVERQVAPITTASIAPPPAATVNPVKIPLPAAKTTAAAEAADSRHPPLVANWVLRDVYDGIALIEGPHGMIEVITGETIPGVGAVKSIERRGTAWTVVTSRGLIEFARN